MHLRGLSIASGIPTSDIEIPFSTSVRVDAVGAKLFVALDSGYVASFVIGGQKPEWQITIPGLDISNIVFLSDKIVTGGSGQNDPRHFFERW